MGDAGLLVIELFEEEFVVARGTAEVHWFVRENDAWTHCASYPSARSERLDAPAGTVYRTRVELDLPPETRLMRVESRPARPAHKSAVEHLLQPHTNVPRNTRRSYYQVGPRGNLLESD
jgi:hypothetical protein